MDRLTEFGLLLCCTAIEIYDVDRCVIALAIREVDDGVIYYLKKRYI